MRLIFYALNATADSQSSELIANVTLHTTIYLHTICARVMFMKSI